MLALSLIGFTCDAEPAHRIEVVVVNLPQLCPRDLSTSLNAAALLYRGTPVHPQWTTQSTPYSKALPGNVPKRLIILLDQPSQSKFTVREQTLGIALTDRAFIFLPKIQQLAAAKQVPLSAILSVVIAHELGHLLLGPGHSPAGVMRPTCGNSEFDLAQRGQPGFTRHQARQMRARLGLLR
ncbi:MAG: hypothetical protein IT168_02855 [Bryobacterales bacterium]|nr:hypothetical protein [Bryobacterales bacterium]